MYRAVALYLIEQGIDMEDHERIAASLEHINISFHIHPDSGLQETLLNGRNVEHDIRTNPRVAAIVSVVSALPEVRARLLIQQRAMALNKGLVMDGRDIGSVIFPDAELKFFVTASPEVRAERRHREFLSKGLNISYDSVLENLRKRDQTDTTRPIAPLKKADDAIEINNDHMSREEQLEFVLKIARSRAGMEEAS
jgi:cytidylate kinase